MKRFLVLVAVTLAVTAAWISDRSTSSSRKIPVVSACDLYSKPEKFDGLLVEVIGRINVQFESMTLVCFNKEAKTAPLLFGVWLRLDLNSIRDRSPKFYPMIFDRYQAAGKWKGGLIGEMRFRGHFILSKDWTQLPESDEPKQRSGFGHFAMYGAEVVVEEVLDYKSTIQQ